MFELIAFDADDTLWHNELLYDQTQAQLIELLADYADGQTVVQRLFATEMQNLELYGYGIKSFTLSMIETAIEVSAGQITGVQIRQIIDFARQMLNADIQLLKHVPETIKALADSYRLMIITKGDLLDQQSKLARSGLTDYFEAIEIVSEKNEAIYIALLRQLGVAPAHFLMVGNSLRSDILPVVAIGGQAIYIPYHLTWQHEVVDSIELHRNGYYELEHLGQLPALLEKLR
jgi:putative hydrolase of the HAD superfamily